MSTASLNEKLEWVFRLFDSDNDLCVSKDEILEIMSVRFLFSIFSRSWGCRNNKRSEFKSEPMRCQELVFQF